MRWLPWSGRRPCCATGMGSRSCLDSGIMAMLSHKRWITFFGPVLFYWEMHAVRAVFSLFLWAFAACVIWSLARARFRRLERFADALRTGCRTALPSRPAFQDGSGEPSYGAYATPRRTALTS